MKNLKVLAIAFVIGTSSLIASNLDHPPHQYFKGIDTPFAVESESTQPEDINTTGVYINAIENINLNNFNYNNRALLLEEMKMEAVKNYQYIMPEIIGKE
jgi:hypothetical protein